MASTPVSITRDLDAGAGEPGGPGGRGADLRHALLEQRIALAVEPDHWVVGGQALPQSADVGLGGVHGGAPGHRTDLVEAGFLAALPLTINGTTLLRLSS